MRQVPHGAWMKKNRPAGRFFIGRSAGAIHHGIEMLIPVAFPLLTLMLAELPVLLM